MTAANPSREARLHIGLAPLIDESGKPDLNLESYARFFTEPVYTQIFIKSFVYALVTTLACLVVAYPLATLIAKSPKKHRDLLLLLVILPFWSNFLIRVYAWMIVLGPQAALARTIPVWPDFLVALPLAPARQRQRGFNQAQEIARRLARLGGAPAVAGLARGKLCLVPMTGWRAGVVALAAASGLVPGMPRADAGSKADEQAYRQYQAELQRI